MSPRACSDAVARSGGCNAPGGIGLPRQAAARRRDAARIATPQPDAGREATRRRATAVPFATWLAAALAAVAIAAPAADRRSDPPRTTWPPAAVAASSATPGPDAGIDAKGTGFAAARHVIAGGGGASASGAFAVAGTIGQVDVDPLQPATGGVFAIHGGFWPGSAPRADTVFAHGFEPAAL